MNAGIPFNGYFWKIDGILGIIIKIRKDKYYFYLYESLRILCRIESGNEGER